MATMPKGPMTPADARIMGATELFGRMEIVTGVDEITRDNLPMVMSRCVAIHNFNACRIEYLYGYVRGWQPILERVKNIRSEINNKVVENHAAEIAQFVASYFLGEPVTYVRRGTNEDASADVAALNDWMAFEDKSTWDMQLAYWMAVCGVGYRMVLPDRSAYNEEDDAPFELDVPDPRLTFVAYSSGFGHRPVLGVRLVWRQREDDEFELIYCGYTRTHYFEMGYGMDLRRWEPHALDAIPIFEYRLNMSRTGSFEVAIPMLDAINAIQSNRVDALEQFVQSFLKFKNCEVDEKVVSDLRKMGAIVIKSINGLDSDVDIISQELNQEQTQTLVDYLYDQVLAICGLPTSTKGGASTSDTGNAVFLRDGWSQAESRAKDTERLFEKSEREFLRLTLRIIRDTRSDFGLTLREVECKFTRRQHDNLQSKTQALQSMLQSGIAPEVAISTCGLFNDPMDVCEKSKKYLVKWDPVPMVPGTPDGGDDA